jgi:hypothetical protein
MHSFASNTSRLTVPANGDGLYIVGCHGEIAGTGTGSADFGVQVLLNGATVLCRDFGDYNRETQVRECSTLYSLSATDYIEMQVYTEIDVDLIAQSNYSPVLWATWVRMQ